MAGYNSLSHPARAAGTTEHRLLNQCMDRFRGAWPKSMPATRASHFSKSGYWPSDFTVLKQNGQAIPS